MPKTFSNIGSFSSSSHCLLHSSGCSWQLHHLPPRYSCVFFSTMLSLQPQCLPAPWKYYSFILLTSLVAQIAAVLVPIIIGMWISTGGAVIAQRYLLKPFIWIFWSNPLQYTLNSLTSIAFYCDTYKAECLNGGANMACLNDPSKCLQCNCPRLLDANNTFVWTQLQFNRSLNHGRIKIDMLALACFCILFRFMAFLALKYKKSNGMFSK